MSAGDSYLTITNTGTQNNLTSTTFCKDTENPLIDNKGDNCESGKAWDNNFSERLANFMKNSKSLLENIDKKHNNVKFQHIDNNGTDDTHCLNGLESPTHTLVELEESLLQLDDSKLKYIQKNDNKRSSEPSSKINPDIELTDTDSSSITSSNLKISSHNKIYFPPKNNVCTFSDLNFNSECNTLNSSVSLNHLEDSVNYDSVKIMEINRDQSTRHGRHMTYSGSTDLPGSNISTITAFKLALHKKRANLLKDDIKTQEKFFNNTKLHYEKDEQIGIKYINTGRNKGFQNVINAILSQNHNQKSNENCINNERVLNDINRLASPYLSKISKSELMDDEKNANYNVVNEISYLLTGISKNNKNCLNELSVTSNNSLVEISQKMKKLPFEPPVVNSNLGISNVFLKSKLEKFDGVFSSESNLSQFTATKFKHSSPIDSVSVTGKSSADSNEKENISELSSSEKIVSESASKKYSVNKNHNFQEALRMDELESELNKMKTHLKEKDKKINVLESVSTDPGKLNKPTHINIGTNVGTIFNGDPIDRKQASFQRGNMLGQIPFDEFSINSSNKVIYDADSNNGCRPYNDSNEYSSIKDYNPNNSSALRNKIRDLESQIQDLQEANENAAQIMSSLKQKSTMDTTISTQSIVSELIEKNNMLREEVDRLNQSIPILKGDTISTQFLRQELENLKEDLYALKQQNNLIVKENIALKNHLKKKENISLFTKKHEDRNSTLCQLNEYTKPSQSISNDIYELNNHSNGLSDSDDSIYIPPSIIITNNQSKVMSVTNLSANLSSFRQDTLSNQPKKVCKILPQSNKRKSNDCPVKKICHKSEFEDNTYAENIVTDEKKIIRMNNDNCSYEKNDMDLSNDSTDSILSDANKEMQDMILQSEVDNNIPTFLKSRHDKKFVNDVQLDKQFSKRKINDEVNNSDFIDINKFSTLGRTAYAPRASYDVNIGDVVKFIRQGGRISKGLVHYVGPLPSRKDTYLGIELEIEDGKHDGIYDGKRYFQCLKNKGVFVAFNKIIMVYSRKI